MPKRPEGPPPSSAGFNPEEVESSLKVGEDFGQYEIVKLLGVGGMGEVYEVKHRVLDTRHALKLINESIMKNKVALSYFKSEGRVMAQLHHPGIVLVDEFGETDGRYWLRMELMTGVECTGGDLITLEDYVWYMGGKLTDDEVKECMRQFLDAIGFAHSRGVVHRDLKPTNILLHPTGMKIADFGLVKMAGDGWHKDRIRSSISSEIELDVAAKAIKGRSGPRTAEKAIVGTYEYMAPEQKRGDDVDARSDLYAVGLICFQILTGEETPGFKKPSELQPGISPEWDTWLEKVLHTSPDDRFQTAESMKQALPKKKPVTQSSKADPSAQDATDNLPHDQTKPKGASSTIKPWLPLIYSSTGVIVIALITILILKSLQKPKEVVEDIDPPAAAPTELPKPPPPQITPSEPEPTEPEPTVPDLKLPPTADVLYLAKQELIAKFEIARSQLTSDIKGIEEEHQQETVSIQGLPAPDSNPPPLPEPIADAGFRTWAYPNGGTFVATLKEVGQSELTLSDDNGQTARLPRFTIRDEDLSYVEDWESTYLPVEESPFVIHSAQVFMRWIPSGTVRLGTDNVNNEFPEESPATRVRISKGFWIGQYEITQTQLENMLEVNPSEFDEGSDYPADSISWARAKKFCEETNRIESEAGRLPSNWSYNLPTEAQWQLAAGDGTAPLSQTCWYASNSEGSSRRIGLLAPNSFGLYDMKGNVKEWVLDVFAPYPGGAQKDWVNDSGGFNHILRGGSWKSPSDHCRINTRSKPRSGYQGNDAGFRIALVFKK